jgi:hypothetical protein
MMDCKYRLHEQIYSDENGINESCIYRYDESGVLLFKIAVSGDVTKIIDETKFNYNENGLLCSCECNSSFYNYEYDELYNLKKRIRFNKNTKKIDYEIFEYKGKQKIKQSIYSSEDILKHELTFEYDNMGRRIAIFRDNEFFGFREYDNNGLVKKYHIKTGNIVNFVWENKSSNYDWNMIYGF